MNKAIRIISEWVSEKETYLAILIDRRDTEKKWSKVKSKADYYTPKYQATTRQVETLEREISECKQALILLNESFGTTE